MSKTFGTPLLFTMPTTNLFVDASKFGVYLNSLLSTHKWILNQDYSKMYAIINAHEGVLAKPYTIEEKESISNIFDTVKLNRA